MKGDTLLSFENVQILNWQFRIELVLMKGRACHGYLFKIV